MISTMDIKADARRLRAKRAQLERELAETTNQLRDLAIQALREGYRPGVVRELTGWSAAQVRIIARAAGVPPASVGRSRAE